MPLSRTRKGNQAVQSEGRVELAVGGESGDGVGVEIDAKYENAVVRHVDGLRREADELVHEEVLRPESRIELALCIEASEKHGSAGRTDDDGVQRMVRVTVERVGVGLARQSRDD